MRQRGSSQSRRETATPRRACSAGASTFAAALEEAYCLALEASGPVLITCADDAAPEILRSRAPGIAVASAFVLASESASPHARLPLRTAAAMDDIEREEAPPHLRGSVVFPAIRLLHELAQAGSKRELPNRWPRKPASRDSEHENV